MEYNADKEASDEEEVVPIDFLSSVIIPPLDLEANFNVHMVRITHIESPSNFYVMLEENVEYFEMFNKNLNESYADEIFSPTANELPVGSNWCVNINGNWRRAKIMSNIGKLKKTLDGKPIPFYMVLLVDRGSTECVSLNEVRYLNDQFAANAPMAIPCILSDVYPISDQDDWNWSPTAVQAFIDLCVDEVHNAILWSKKLSLHYDCILEKVHGEKDGHTINELMTVGGYATPTLMETFVDDNVIESVSEKSKKDELSNSEGILENAQAVGSVSDDNAKIDHLSDWNPMIDHKDEAETLLNESDSENYFLGYKNEDEKNICAYIRYDKPCPRGENCKWLHTKPRDDGLPSGTDIVFDKLKCPPIRPVAGDMYRGMVLTATSPTMFYTLFEIADISGMDMLKEIEDNLTEAYKHEPYKSAQTMPGIGELMVLHQEEGDMPGYYRVRVLELSMRNLGVLVKVLYIDYGTQEWVKECQLRPIFECFLYTPAQAVECYLFDVNQKGDTWDPEAMTCFTRLVDDKFGTVTVLSADNISDRYGIELEFTDDQVGVINVNSTLVVRGLAEADE